ncbi:MAG: hypothetical protein DSO03_05555 [Hadesarchaea archaeon]|nr:MAG: hypothetical protein DSO03_05555 [Hadesarchaea archaeon]
MLGERAFTISLSNVRSWRALREIQESTRFYLTQVLPISVHSQGGAMMVLAIVHVLGLCIMVTLSPSFRKPCLYEKTTIPPPEGKGRREFFTFKLGVRGET